MEEHQPVLLTEALYFLNVKPGKRYIDATVGGGGHSEAILKEGGEVLGIDQDPKALTVAERRLSSCPGVFRLAAGNFAHLQEIASKADFTKTSGILFDLGVASFQLEDPSFGLTFAKDAPLDMRLDPTLGVTAADLVNSLNEKQLAQLFFEKAGEKRSRELAHAISGRRTLKPIKTTKELAELVEKVSGGRSEKIHPATKVFLALRMAVNLELENLQAALPQALALLAGGGRLVVISFHSGEDRIVKNFLRGGEKAAVLKILNRKPVVPSEAEVRANPRARSGKLRAAEKI